MYGALPEVAPSACLFSYAMFGPRSPLPYQSGHTPRGWRKFFWTRLISPTATAWQSRASATPPTERASRPHSRRRSSAPERKRGHRQVCVHYANPARHCKPCRIQFLLQRRGATQISEPGDRALSGPLRRKNCSMNSLASPSAADRDPVLRRAACDSPRLTADYVLPAWRKQLVDGFPVAVGRWLRRDPP